MWHTPSSSALDLDEITHNCRSEADHALGRLREAVRQLPNRAVLVDSTRRHDIQSMLAIRRVAVLDRDIARVELPAEKRQVPYDVARYVQVMSEATREVGTIPVSEVLMRVVRDLSGPATGLRGAVADDDLPWRTTVRWFGDSAEDAYLFGPPPGTGLRAETKELFAWIDGRPRSAAVTTLSVGVHRFYSLYPFTNTPDMLHVLATLILVDAEKVPDQVVPIAMHLDRNWDDFCELHKKATRTDDYNDVVRFFAAGLREQCENRLRVVDELRRLPERYNDKYMEEKEAKQRRDGLARVIDLLPSFQIVTSELLAEKCGFSRKRARELLVKVEELEFVEHIATRHKTKYYEVKDIQRTFDLYGGMVPERDRDALRNDLP